MDVCLAALALPASLIRSSNLLKPEDPVGGPTGSQWKKGMDTKKMGRLCFFWPLLPTLISDHCHFKTALRFFSFNLDRSGIFCRFCGGCGGNALPSRCCPRCLWTLHTSPMSPYAPCLHVCHLQRLTKCNFISRYNLQPNPIRQSAAPGKIA